MDSREPPDTNVVRLRREGDLTDEERKRLASTIFAEQDEVATFSRGNLVPPKPATPPASEDSSAPDPFFEKLQADLPRDHTRAPAGASGHEDTTAYFERLGAQTPAEMSQSMAPEMAATAMPGSARLPGEMATPAGADCTVGSLPGLRPDDRSRSRGSTSQPCRCSGRSACCWRPAPPLQPSSEAADTAPTPPRSWPRGRQLHPRLTKRARRFPLW
jgi:hypothetical protein